MKILAKLNSVIRKHLLISALALVTGLFSSCATSSYQEPPRPSYSESQVSKWKSYLATSPLSNDISPRSSSVRSVVNSELPARYNDHIQSVASHIDQTALAQQRYAAEIDRITGNYTASKVIAPEIGSAAYRLMRDQNSSGTFGDALGNIFVRLVAEGMVESNYRSQLQNAAETIMNPVVENGKRLVLAEDVLTRDMRVAPTRQLSQKVQAISDEHYRQLLPGVWKEHFVWHKVWLFSSNGNFQWEFPIKSSADSGRWSVNNGVLTLQTRFGSSQYRLAQEGKSLIFLSVDGNKTSKLEFVSSDSSDYRQLLRNLNGGNFRINANF